jgi:Holliday junction DNA helicase RuvA
MISSIEGTISQKSEKSIEVNIQGLGYKIFITQDLLSKVKAGEKIKLLTELRIKDEILSLYGFSSVIEREYFRYLTSISGIGSKSALNILSLISLKKLQAAIANERAEVLTKVSGIGKKTAERIILELKSKIKKNHFSEEDIRNDNLAIDALIGMGYPLEEARRALRKIGADQNSEKLTAEQKIKKALQYLSS